MMLYMVFGWYFGGRLQLGLVLEFKGSLRLSWRSFWNCFAAGFGCVFGAENNGERKSTNWRINICGEEKSLCHLSSQWQYGSKVCGKKKQELVCPDKNCK